MREFKFRKVAMKGLDDAVEKESDNKEKKVPWPESQRHIGKPWETSAIKGRICSAPGCDILASSKGFCWDHKKYGQQMALLKKKKRGHCATDGCPRKVNSGIRCDACRKVYIEGKLAAARIKRKSGIPRDIFIRPSLKPGISYSDVKVKKGIPFNFYGTYATSSSVTIGTTDSAVSNDDLSVGDGTTTLGTSDGKITESKIPPPPPPPPPISKDEKTLGKTTKVFRNYWSNYDNEDG